MFNYNGVESRLMLFNYSPLTSSRWDYITIVNFTNTTLLSNLIITVIWAGIILVSTLTLTHLSRKMLTSNALFGPLQFLQYYDMFSIVLVYVTSISLVFLLNIFGLHLLKFNALACTFGVYLQPVLLLPFLYMAVFSTNTLLCLGLVQKTSLIGAFINDCITLVSFLLRFGSQYIRIILIMFVFILFYEYLNTVNNLLFSIKSVASSMSLSSAALVAMRIGFELCDCFFILLMQFNTFFIILLWLLSFLFVLKFNNIFEK